MQADSITYAQVPLSQEKQAQNSARPDKLAIGGEGGFQLEEDMYDIEKSQALTVLPEGLEISLPCPDLPELVLNAIKGVMVRALTSSFIAHSCTLRSLNLCLGLPVTDLVVSSYQRQTKATLSRSA